jgi:hypothetical protein
MGRDPDISVPTDRGMLDRSTKAVVATPVGAACSIGPRVRRKDPSYSVRRKVDTRSYISSAERTSNSGRSGSAKRWPDTG